MSLHGRSQILFRFFVGLMQWVEYYHKILQRQTDIAVNVFMIGSKDCPIPGTGRTQGKDCATPRAGRPQGQGLRYYRGRAGGRRGKSLPLVLILVYLPIISILI